MTGPDEQRGSDRAHETEEREHVRPDADALEPLTYRCQSTRNRGAETAVEHVRSHSLGWWRRRVSDGTTRPFASPTWPRSVNGLAGSGFSLSRPAPSVCPGGGGEARR